MHGTHSTPLSDHAMRRALWWVAAANFVYFLIEGIAAYTARSVSLFADSVDFLEDATVNALVLLALGWSLKKRARLGYALAGITLIPAAGALWTAWQHLLHQTIPAAPSMTLVACGALIVNLACALILAKYQYHGGSLTKAAFLCARNDVLANIAMIIAGGITLYHPSPWPDLVVGLALVAMNVDAAREIALEARREHHRASTAHA